MVDRGRYFSIFAPRQSGKTTFLKKVCRELHEDQTYVAVILSFRKYKELNKKVFYAQVQKHLYRQLTDRLTVVKCEKLPEIQSFLNTHWLTDHISFSDLFEELNQMIEYKKIVVFIDGIPRKELENFLTTLRDLYQQYKDIKQKALYSVGLIGIRNITKLIVGGVSPLFSFREGC